MASSCRFIPFKFRCVMGAFLMSLFGCAPQNSTNNSAHNSTHNSTQNVGGVQPRFSSIVGGTIVKERSTRAAKSLVLIEFFNQHQQKISTCAAALVGPQTLLTAAHCFDLRRLRMVSFRVVFQDRGGARSPRKALWGQGYSMHPKYNKHKVFDHDIALAVFEGVLPSGFAPVNIDSDVNANYANQKVYVYGYGRSSNETGSNQTGNEKKEIARLRRGVMFVGLDYTQYPDRYITSAESKTFLCSGDSGGPQFYHEKGVLKIIGVNSAHFGELLPNGKRACTGLAQATKVAPFHEWIMIEQKKLLSQMR